MLPLLFTRRQKILFIIYFLLIIITTLITYQQEYANVPASELIFMKKQMPDMGISFFYTIQEVGLYLYQFFLICLILNNIINTQLLTLKQNHHDNMIITRLTKQEYHHKAMFLSFISAFMIMLMTHLLTIMTIKCLMPFPLGSLLGEAVDQYQLIPMNAGMNLLLYIILSSIGGGILALFMFCLQAYIHNIYLYRVLGLILGFSTLLGGILLSGLLRNLHLDILVQLILFIQTINLTHPGIILNTLFHGPLLLAYFGCLCFYVFMIILLFKGKHDD